jgi:signal transduction histidine kinase
MQVARILERQLDILVIEDNPHDARLVELYLRQVDMIDRGITVCQTMQEALDLLATHPGFDAIISDLTLPDSKGMDTVESLVRARPDQTIIIQTGYNDKEIGLMAVKAGAQDFLVKGAYEPDDLAKVVRYSIERRSIIERLESTQRRANIGNFELKVEEGLVTASAEYCRMLGLGEKATTLAISEVLAERPCLGPLFDLASDGQASVIDIERDVYVESADGTKKWFALTGKQSADGKQIIGLLQDITTRRETEDMRHQNEVSQQATLMKEQFIASVSHEMRTPMNAILGMSNLLLDHSLGEEQRNYIHSIKQSSELLLGIVNDILTISSLQNNAVQFDLGPFNLHELFANIMNIISYKVFEKKLMFDLQIARDVPANLIGDKLRLNQIMINLIGNAIKFTDHGVVRVYVNMVKSEGDWITIEFVVSDTGIGIPANKLEAVFESFTRIKYKDRIFEGTGLGLSITKKLVEQQGGVIGAMSDVGVGSTFTCKLNFQVADQPVPGAQLPQTQLQLFDDQTAFRILLAEDNKLNQIVALKTIERKFPNATIELAVNGEEATRLLTTNTYHVVLMDLQMPVMDGTEAVQWLRTQGPESSRSAFVIAMTAHAHMGESGQVEAIMVDDFVLKPFEPEQLFSKLVKYAALALDGQRSVFGR